MKVYRIENPVNHMGPFNDPQNRMLGLLCGFKSAHLAGGQIDEQSLEFRLTNGHSNYGCTDLEGIKKWFPLELREIMKEAGFKLLEFDLKEGTPTQKFPNKQIVFNRHDKTLKTKELDLIKCQ